MEVGTDYHAISAFGQRKLHAVLVLNCASDGSSGLMSALMMWIENDLFLLIQAHGVGAGTAAGAGMSMVVKSAGLTISRYSMSGE